MEVNSAKNYIKNLNRNSLIEYLTDQNFSTEAQLLQSRDIDGERFLSFTELDLIQWGLKATQKKMMLNCRNKLIDKKVQEMVPKFTVPNKFDMQKENTKPSKVQNVAIENRTIIRTQRPLPDIPKKINDYPDTQIQYDVPKRYTPQSMQYVDMGQGKTVSLEGGDYVDMGHGIMAIPKYISAPSAPSKSAPTVPKRPDNFNPITLKITQESFSEELDLIPWGIKIQNVAIENRTIIRTQKPLPDIPKKIDDYPDTQIQYDVPKRYTPQSMQYVDMGQGKTVSLEGKDHGDMGHGIMAIPEYINAPSAPSKSAPTVPKRPENFNPITPKITQEVKLHTNTRSYAPKIPERPQNLKVKSSNHPILPQPMNVQSIPTGTTPKPAKKENDINRIYPPQAFLSELINVHNKTAKKEVTQHLEKREKNGETHQRTEGTSKLQLLHAVTTIDANEGDDYLEHTPIISSSLKSSSRSNSPLAGLWEGARNSPQEVRKCPPLPKHSTTLPPSPDDTDEIEGIYEMEPIVDSKFSTRKPTKVSIQNMALPPIPTLDSKLALAPALSNRFNQLPQNGEIQKHAPKNTENWSTKGHDAVQSNNDFDEYVSWWDMSAPRTKDESMLPRPPVFRASNHDLTFLWDDFFPDVDTPSSGSDSDSFDNECYRNTDRKGAKQLLARVRNLRDDTFLVRPSTHRSYFLGLTIYNGGYYYNLGIYKDAEGKYYGESLDENETVKFSSLDDFVGYYKHNGLTVKKKDGRVVELYLKHFLPPYVY